VHRLLPALAVAAACLTFTASASAQASRTWVSGVGDDVNPCSRYAPCKTFAGAIANTAAGGEINALDPGGYGSVTITKAITIDVTGVPGGIANTGAHGVIVNAGDNDAVVLRGLSIHGNTGSYCGYGGQSGVRVLRAKSVRIEDTTIARQNKAIDITPGTGPVDVVVNRVELNENCVSGVSVAPTGSGAAKVMVRASSITNSGTAVSVGDGGAAWLTGNLVFGNALGLQANGAGEIGDFGDNRYAGNTADGSATKDLSPKAPAGPAGPTGATGATGATGPQGEPALKLLLAATKAKLAARAGRPVTLSYAATAAGQGVLTVARGGKKVATVTAATKAGANEIRWRDKRAAAGVYTLSLRVRGADGQVATTTVALKLRRR
jgi:hypothetical protein